MTTPNDLAALAARMQEAQAEEQRMPPATPKRRVAVILASRSSLAAALLAHVEKQGE